MGNVGDEFADVVPRFVVWCPAQTMSCPNDAATTPKAFSGLALYMPTDVAGDVPELREAAGHTSTSQLRLSTAADACPDGGGHGRC